MDAAYLSAISALAGSMIGGATSLLASWLTHHVQFNAQQRALDLSKREELYRNFIDEASRWYMRIVSSPSVVESADRVALTIIETYLAPNRAFPDIRELANANAINPLREFSNACREELRLLFSQRQPAWG